MLENTETDSGPEISPLPMASGCRMPEAKNLPQPTQYRASGHCDFNLNEFVWMDAGSSPAILQQIFAMRYSVYCLERKFLDPDLYDDNCETDEFDDTSIHLAIRHKLCSEITATARIVVSDTPEQHDQSLPLYSHCNIEPEEQDFLAGVNKLGEVSRFAMSKSAIRHVTHVQKMHLEQTSNDLVSIPTPAAANFSAILSLYKSIYQSSRLNGINYLLAAMEKSLRRLFQKFHFPFHQIGREVDYYGPVAPFILDLDELDAVLSEKMPWLLAEFRDGLEDNVLAYCAGFASVTTEHANALASANCPCS